MVKITGGKEFAAKLRAVSDAKIGRAVSKAVEVTAQQIAVDAQISLSTNSVSGKHHVPSAPGSPPNTDTGVLAGNIEHEMTGPLTAIVASRAPYSAFLEYGTSRIAERPFMRPAAARGRATLEENVTAAINHVIKSELGK